MKERSIWEEILKAAAAACLIAALTAVAVKAQEAPAIGTTSQAPASGTTSEAPAEGTTSEEAAGGSTAGASSAETAPEVEPDPDLLPPEVCVRMTQEVRRDENGCIYCRAENAGICVEMEEKEKDDLGIVSYSIVMRDSAGKEVRMEERVNEKALEVGISPETTAGLSDGEITVEATASDAAGNRGRGEIRFILDTVNPVVTVCVGEPAGNPAAVDAGSGIVYYGKDPGQYEGGRPEITATFTVWDQNPAPGQMELRTLYAPVPEGRCCEQERPSWENAVSTKRPEDGKEAEGESARQMQLTLQIFPGSGETPDGVYRFGIKGTDQAGNPLVAKGNEDSRLTKEPPGGRRGADETTALICENAQAGIFMTGRKVVDTKAPGGELCVENERGDVYYRMQIRDKGLDSAQSRQGEGFTPFRREDHAVIAYRAKDSSPVSVSFRIRSTSGERNDAPPDPERFTYEGGGRILLRGEQAFGIEETVFRDRAGNVSGGPADTGNLYLDLDTPGTDIDAPSAVVRATSGITSRSPDGRGLYDGPVALEIFAEDPEKGGGGSGLGQVRCTVAIDKETVRDEVLFLGGEEPVYRFFTQITIPSGGQWESNDIEVTVSAEDRAGNPSAPDAVLRLGVDTGGPEVTVRYDNNDVRNGHYFDRERNALVTVRERNFDRGRLQVKAAGAAAGEWKRDPGGDPDLWTMELQFGIDGAYAPEVTGTDALGNPASVSCEGEAPLEFVIDRMPPLIEILWDNEDVRNGKYYNRARCATIRVTDFSFDDRAVKIVPFSRPFRKVSQMRDERMAGLIGVYEAEIPFTQEGEWTLGCLCTDLAGNSAAPVFEEPFVIDTRAPRLYFDTDTVQERGAYGEGISPVLRGRDENMAPGSLCARWSNLTAGGSTMECRGASGAQSFAVELPDLPAQREDDGVSMLWGMACDLAGNRTMVRRNLCVNRFGSVYDIAEDEKTMEMVKEVYTDARTPFVIAEYNVSPVTHRQITLYRNGNAAILEEGKDYSVSEERTGAGMRYLCAIDPAAYSAEGRYSLLVESEDEAGNYSSSPGRLMGGAGSSVFWAVDRTPPTVRLTGADPGQTKFVTDRLSLRLIPADNMEVSELTIEVTDEKGEILISRRMGEEALGEILERSAGEVPFEIPARGEWQTIRATAVDGAGNRSSGLEGIEEGSCRVLVSTNLMVHLYRSGALPALAFLALIWAIHYAYIVYKRTLA